MSANSSAIAARPAFFKGNLLPILCAATVSLSAFLLFLLEPLFAKMILPWFGGSAAVWATCLVFFQSALLLGYCYADITSRKLSPRKQIFLHLALLLLALFFIPIAPGVRWRPSPGENPFWHILGLLTFAIGIPYTVLSTTSPLVQTWYARCRPGKDAYYLFSLSNLASFLALLSYPFLIEPIFATHLQATLWSVVFAVFAAICAATAWTSRGGEAILFSKASDSEPPGTSRKLHWLALAACGSMLLLTITDHLTQNVAPVPLLWVLPLALYLLSFTLVFSRRGLYNQWLFIRLLAVFLGAMGYVLYDARGLNAIQVSVPLFGVGLFVACMFCHGELNRLRPDESHLTLFYLALSLGAALGAIFVGLVAPHIFDNLYEFPLTLLFTAVLALFTFWSDGWSARALWGCVTVAMTIVLVMNVRAYGRNSFVMVRNFYGALRVTETSDFGDHKARVLFHGTIRHGAQYELLPWRKQPTTYYSLDSGIGLALRYCCSGPKRVGIIGLGAGTLAAYGTAGDYLHFYEINPAVINIANTVFTYLRDSPARKEITLGDARLSLENEPPQNFDVLAVDAFSGDAIPVHLLTKEAVALYLKHLKPDGILAIHTSNTYLRLNPVVKQLAENAGCEARSVRNESDDDQFIATAEWVLVTRNRAFLNSDIIQKDSTEIDVPRGLRLWTDDYNNLFQILKPVTLRPSTPD
jgi:hypothetical protein